MLVLRARVFLHQPANEGAQLSLRCVVLRQRIVDDALQPGDVFLRDVHQQLVLVPEVVIQRGFRQAAGLRHLVHRRARIAAAGEQGRGLREDHLALVVVAGVASASHVSARRRKAPRVRWSDAPGR